MMDINVDLFQWFITFMIKKPSDMVLKVSGSGIKNKNTLNKELAEELQKYLFENLKYKKHTNLLKIIFEVLILPLCN